MALAATVFRATESPKRTVSYTDRESPDAAVGCHRMCYVHGRPMDDVQLNGTVFVCSSVDPSRGMGGHATVGISVRILINLVPIPGA